MKKITLKELMKVNSFKAGRVISALNRNRVKTTLTPAGTIIAKIKNLLK